MEGLRGALAIIAGLAVTVILSVATDLLMPAIGVFGPGGEPTGDGGFALATLYRCVFEILGCWVAARLAPAKPMHHALILGAIGFLLAALGLILKAEAGPRWYPVALVLTALPCAWLGGRLAERRRA